MEESSMNVKIPTELKNEVKFAAYKTHVTLRTFVINALRDKLEEVVNETNSKDS